MKFTPTFARQVLLYHSPDSEMVDGLPTKGFMVQFMQYNIGPIYVGDGPKVYFFFLKIGK